MFKDASCNYSFYFKSQLELEDLEGNVDTCNNSGISSVEVQNQVSKKK